MSQPRNDQGYEVAELALDDYAPAPYNPRQISEHDAEALRRSIERWGDLENVVVNRRTGHIVSGHQRMEAARAAGRESFRAVVLDVDEDEEKLINLAMNRIRGEWEPLALGELLLSLDELPAVDLSLTGFTLAEVGRYGSAYRASQGGLTDDDAVPDVPEEPVTKSGDLWLLGEHRLLCGDATKAEDVERLMDGELAALMATDPPFLVDYQGGDHPTSKGNRGSPKRDKHWDDYHDPQSSEFFKKFLQAGLAHLRDNAAVYQWHAYRRQALVEQAWTEAGLIVHQQLIWVKERPVLTHSDYLWQHEPCFYGWVKKNPPKRKPPANETTVWHVDRRGQNDNVHPTQKPTELFQRPISFHTEPGDICYEPFLGSGTTIIACEKLGRRCYAMEIEPGYVDVAVRRWEEYTGREAQRG